MSEPRDFPAPCCAVALLLWATRLVRTGIERAYGGFLRQRLREALSNRAKAAAAGSLGMDEGSSQP
ncbi:hypothetical protein D3C80_2104850 [compost metagenome]